MKKYRLSKQAVKEIDKIYEYSISNFGAKQADKYYSDLIEKIEFIAENPNLFGERSVFQPPVRVCPFEAHVIIYQIGKDDIIEIFRIRAGHEDWLPFAD